MTALPARSRTRRRLAVGVLAVCAALATSACAAGQQAQTAQETPVVDGIGGQAGSIALRDVAIVHPSSGPSYQKGSPAEITFVAVNSGQQDDQLVGVTSPAASGAKLFADETSAVQSLNAAPGAPSASGSGSAPGSYSTSGSTSASSSASGSSASGSSASCATTASNASTSSGSAAGGSLSSITVQAGCSVPFGVNPGDAVLYLVGLTQPLYGGNAVPVTFTFAHGGSVTIQVPVQLTIAPSGVTVSGSSSAEG